MHFSKQKQKQSFVCVGLINLYLSLVLLLFNDKSIILVNGQLEAMGAIMSVVPVTSILATAGLVGVKLAALSRLLQALGYDRAYLANGGSGTAAQPIGLQTNYAYMFPYVPGLNISLKGEHSKYQHTASHHQAKETAVSHGPRKTYPAMGLPGDYENQSKPFRGSETLREIFRNAGINMHIPTQDTQFTKFPKGNGPELTFHVDPTPNHESINIHFKATTPIFNYNRQPQPYPQMPPQLYPELQPPQPPQPIVNDGAPSSSSSLIAPPPPQPPQPQPQPQPQPIQMPNNNNQNVANIHVVDQQADLHSSSNFQPLDHQAHQAQTPSHLQLHHPQTQSFHSQNLQVIRPQPSNSSSVSSLEVARLTTLPSSQVTSVTPTFNHPTVSRTDMLARPDDRFYHPVPQHEVFYRKFLEAKRAHEQFNGVEREKLPSGPLAMVPELSLITTTTPTSYVDNRVATGALTLSSELPNTFGMNSISSNEILTNYSPFETDAPPHKIIAEQNEFDSVNRRRKRHLSGQPSQSSALTLSQRLFPNQDHQTRDSNQGTFGMPALNIHSLRRRSLAEKLYPIKSITS